MKRLDGKSFFRGFGRALDIRGATRPRYERRASWIRSDRAAVAADWQAVWGDLDRAYVQVRQREASPGA
jgi:hypothetical protein